MLAKAHKTEKIRRTHHEKMMMIRERLGKTNKVTLVTTQ